MELGRAKHVVQPRKQRSIDYFGFRTSDLRKPDVGQYLLVLYLIKYQTHEHSKFYRSTPSHLAPFLAMLSAVEKVKEAEKC
jgi:hypothetical protein